MNCRPVFRDAPSWGVPFFCQEVGRDIGYNRYHRPRVLPARTGQRSLIVRACADLMHPFGCLVSVGPCLGLFRTQAWEFPVMVRSNCGRACVALSAGCCGALVLGLAWLFSTSQTNVALAYLPVVKEKAAQGTTVREQPVVSKEEVLSRFSKEQHEGYMRRAIANSRKAGVEYKTGGAFGAVIVDREWQRALRRREPCDRPERSELARRSARHSPGLCTC